MLSRIFDDLGKKQERERERERQQLQQLQQLVAG